MPKLLVYLGISLIVLAMLPPALIARARTAKTDNRRIHYIQDMDNQAKFRAQHASPLFADGRAARPPVPGTIARGELHQDAHFALGVVDGEWATDYPSAVPFTRELVARGQDRFGIYCSMCHGLAGYGDGIVSQRAMALLDNPSISNGTTWVAAKSVHDPEVRIQPVGQIYSTITNGIRTMSGYASQIPIEDRWAIAAYVKVLQRSQNARETDAPASLRENLPVIDLMPAGEDGS